MMRGYGIFFHLALLGLCVAPTHAGITVDGALSPARSLSGPNYAISADLGRQLGGNLFHSFGSFNLANGESATFSGPGSISNVIGRVTGGSASNIDGTLRCSIPGANLYLINPNGLMFGPHAALDIDGSFFASSASYLCFADGVRFDASAPASSILTSAPPAAFGFLGKAGAIGADGSRLEVATGRNLVLLGGDLTLRGENKGLLVAPRGTVGLVSVTGAGEIATATLAPGAITGYGDIRIEDGQDIAANGRGGNIVIRGGTLVVADSTVVAHNTGPEGGITVLATDGITVNNGLIQSASGGASDAGKIDIASAHLSLLRDGRIDTSAYDTGHGGQIVVNVGDLALSDGGRITNNLLEGSDAQGGNTDIHASHTLRASGKSAAGNLSGIFNNTFSSGDAGSLTIVAPYISIGPDATIQAATTAAGKGGTVRVSSTDIQLNGGAIYAGTEGTGDGGQITVDAEKLLLTGDAQISGTGTGGGQAGNIGISVGTLDLSDGGAISARAYYFPRGGGNIEVTATESITIKGRSEPKSSSPGSDEVSTGIFSFSGDISIATPQLAISDSGGISTRTWNNLRSGDLAVNVARLSLLHGGFLSADDIGHSGYSGGAGHVTVNARESILLSGVAGDRGSAIQSGTRSSGDAGFITVTTPYLRVENGALINTSTGVFGEGGAGTISVQASRVELASGGRILSSSVGYGRGGDIELSADSVVLDGGAISAFGSGDGGAGRIGLHAPLVVMRRGLLNTESGGSSKAGDINIETDSLLMSDASRIKSDSSDTGNAGNISIHASSVFSADNSVVTTGATYASGGNIAIEAGTVRLSGGGAITATVGGGVGDGGNVTIAANGFAAVGNSDITARADQGHGGRIVIDSNVFLRTPDVDLNASSNVSGNEGVVEVNAPTLDISSSLVILSASYLDVTRLLDDPCGTRRAEDASSFIIRGRGGLPLAPDQPLSSVPRLSSDSARHSARAHSLAKWCAGGTP